jgi:hypothetical protein
MATSSACARSPRKVIAAERRHRRGRRAGPSTCAAEACADRGRIPGPFEYARVMRQPRSLLITAPFLCLLAPALCALQGEPYFPPRGEWAARDLAEVGLDPLLPRAQPP